MLIIFKFKFSKIKILSFKLTLAKIISNIFFEFYIQNYKRGKVMLKFALLVRVIKNFHNFNFFKYKILVKSNNILRYLTLKNTTLNFCTSEHVVTLCHNNN